MTQTSRLSKKQIASRNRRKQKLKAITLAISILLIVVAVAIGVIILIVKLGQVKEVKNFKLNPTTSSITITWDVVQKDVSYELLKKDEQGNYVLLEKISCDENPSYTDASLLSATKYEYKIVTVKGEGDKAKKSAGKEASCYTLPLTPEGCSAVTESKNSLTISFNDDNSQASYEIKSSENEDLSNATSITITHDQVTINSEKKSLNYIISNLQEGKTYYFSIRAFVDKNITSQWSEVFYGHVTRAVDMTGVDVNRPMVAITYDDGPGPGNITARIIEAFKKAGGHATFFQLGNRAEGYPDQMKLMVSNGHEIGCHTYDHVHMGAAVTANDIISANDAIERSCGVRPTVFRSPGGETTDLIRSVCLQEGIPVIQWNEDTKDWQSRNADSVCSEIQSNVADGNIILLHNIYDSSAEATERILPWLVEQGYQLVTVSQLIQAKTGAPPEPGIQYYTATFTK